MGDDLRSESAPSAVPRDEGQRRPVLRQPDSAVVFTAFCTTCSGRNEKQESADLGYRNRTGRIRRRYLSGRRDSDAITLGP